MGPDEIFAGRYRIVRFVARGGMGEVYEAYDETLETSVALKRVSFAGLPDDDGASGATGMSTATTARARVLREARLAARLRGVPQVVATYDVLEDGDDVWLVLEYVPSTTLADAVPDRLDPIEVARIGAAVATALAAAHAADVLHRDVKPGNVLLGHDGSVKLTDFGISRGTGEATKLTATDVVSGTPAYMAREVARGEDPSPASDVYALGATLYRAVEGAPPHGTDGNALRLMYRVATEPPRPPEHADTLAPLLVRLLADDPATRPDAATAAELLDAVARRPSEPTVRTGGPEHPSSGTPTLHGEPAAPAPPPSRRRVWLIAAAAAAVVLVVAGVLVAVRLAATGPPTMPTEIAARTLAAVGADRADPCALLDPDALTSFGAVEADRAASPAACGVRVRDASGSARLTVGFEAPASAVSAGAAETALGGATLLRHPLAVGVRSPACPRVLVLADRTQVRVDVTVLGIGASPCDLAEALTAGVADRLDRDGVTADPARPDVYSFGRTDACSVFRVDELTVASPGLTTQGGTPGFARWSCSWGTSNQVVLYFRTDDADPDRFGTPVTAGARRAWQLASAGSCQAWVLQRPVDADRPVAQLASVVVRGADRCAAALSLAGVAADRMPA